MCGIVGIIDNGDKSSNLIESMTSIIKHRGPDDNGFYIDDDIALGHRRLSIIDLDGGHQPMWNDSGTRVIVFNGEIYNFRELKHDLEGKGYVFRTNSDTEVILHTYNEYGQNCLALFKGMFAFAIWDKEAKTLFAARDRLGIKPFYYTQYGKSLAFASELKALLLLQNVNPKINKKAFHYILRTSANLDTETCVKGIFKLPAGHVLNFFSGKVTIQPYWQIPIPKVEYMEEQVWVKRVREALYKSVERRMVSDVPVGSTLSGGLDSSSVVALMSQICDSPVQTFTAGYGHGDPELGYAALVAETFKTDHKEMIITPDRLEEILPTIIWHLDEPIGRTGAVPLFFVFREAARFVKVLLVGEGADEVFAGYQRYKVLSPRLPLTSSMRREVYQYAYTGDKPHTFLGNLSTAFWWRGRMPGSIYLKDYHINEKLPPDTLFNGKESLNSALRFDQQGIMVEWQLKGIDALSMANSVEAREPFLDHELVELLMRVPSHMKCRGLTGKYILRKAMEPILPNRIIKRRKFGQAMRFGEEMSRSLGYLSDLLLTNKIVKERNLFEWNEVEDLKIKCARNKLNRFDSEKLWTIIMIEIWLRIFIDKPISTVPAKSISDLLNTTQLVGAEEG